MTRCVGSRVDWLTVAFRAHLHKDVLASFVVDPKDPRARAPRNARSFVARAALARKYRVASAMLPLDDEPEFQLKMSGEGKTLLKNGSCRIVILENAPKSPDEDRNDPGWSIAVEWSGTELLRLGWRFAARESWRLAGALGEILEARVRRLDLCADMDGFPMPPPEDHEWCTRPQLRYRQMRRAKRLPVTRAERKEKATTGRALLSRFERGQMHYLDLLEQFPDIDDAYYYPAGNLTGWKFGKGSICARVYDKQAEMRMRAECAGTNEAKRKQAGQKKDAEEAYWLENGWSGKGKIIRVECQLRGDVLNELDARCDQKSTDAELFIGNLGQQLDRCWKYFAGAPDELARKEPLPTDEQGRCVKCQVVHQSEASCPHTLAPKSGWLRQILLEGKKRRSECSATPAWKAVQGVTFERELTTVPSRERKRGAVAATQVLGCALALLGYTEQLQRPKNPVPNPETGEMDEVMSDSEDLHATRVAELADVKATIKSELRALFEQTADEVADTLCWIHEKKPEEALALVWTRVNAARARWKPLAKSKPPEPPGEEEKLA